MKASFSPMPALVNHDDMFLFVVTRIFESVNICQERSFLNTLPWSCQTVLCITVSLEFCNGRYRAVSSRWNQLLIKSTVTVFLLFIQLYIESKTNDYWNSYSAHAGHFGIIAYLDVLCFWLARLKKNQRKLSTRYKKFNQKLTGRIWS